MFTYLLIKCAAVALNEANISSPAFNLRFSIDCLVTEAIKLNPQSRFNLYSRRQGSIPIIFAAKWLRALVISLFFDIITFSGLMQTKTSSPLLYSAATSNILFFILIKQRLSSLPEITPSAIVSIPTKSAVYFETGFVKISSGLEYCNILPLIITAIISARFNASI